MLTDILQPFWLKGIMVKRFWGRLLPRRKLRKLLSFKKLGFVRVDTFSLSNVANNDLYNCNVLCKSSVKPCLSSLKKPVNYCLYQNSRGLRTKLSTMNRNIADFYYIFISLSET